MTDVRVRNVDDWVVESLRLRARSEGQSLEGALRELLRQEALRPKQELADRLRRTRAHLYKKYGRLSDSAELIRAERDERG